MTLCNIDAITNVDAYGVYKAAIKKGYQIPEDISIIGFDDLFYSGIMEVPLTTIHQPAYEIGETAVIKFCNSRFQRWCRVFHTDERRSAELLNY